MKRQKDEERSDEKGGKRSDWWEEDRNGVIYRDQPEKISHSANTSFHRVSESLAVTHHFPLSSVTSVLPARIFLPSRAAALFRCALSGNHGCCPSPGFPDGQLKGKEFNALFNAFDYERSRRIRRRKLRALCSGDM